MVPIAPWWGVPVIAGSFLIIGGLLAFLYSLITEGRKAKREDVRRFENDIRRLHVAIFRAAAPFSSTDSLTWSNSEERAIKLADLRQAISAMEEAMFELMIIADNAVLDKVNDVVSNAVAVVDHLDDGGEVSPPLLESVAHALHRLVGQMRNSLRIPEDVKVTQGM
jgi:hypothetical protein